MNFASEFAFVGEEEENYIEMEDQELDQALTEQNKQSNTELKEEMLFASFAPIEEVNEQKEQNLQQQSQQSYKFNFSEVPQSIKSQEEQKLQSQFVQQVPSIPQEQLFSFSNSNQNQQLQTEQSSYFGEGKNEQQKPMQQPALQSQFQFNPWQSNQQMNQQRLEQQQQKIQFLEQQKQYNWQKSSQSVPQQIPQVAQQGIRHKQAVDTNVVSIKLNILTQESNLATGDPVRCKSCESLLNSHSEFIATSKEATYIWNCEFCEMQNLIQLEQEEIPKSNQLTYILESSQQVKDKNVQLDDISILFVVDTSGSMGVTQPVKEKIKLRVDPLQELRKLQNAQDGPQYLPGQSHFTYISRLQCVQAAIDKQIENMTKVFPNRHVGLITFSGDVNIVGDGTQAPQTITGDWLNDAEKLSEIVKDSHPKWMGSQIQACHKDLIDKLWKVQESGPTALGPALLMAVELVGQGRAGSKVIICTDGIANVGLGNLEDQNQQEFYINCAEIAKNKGIEISIISIEGQECKLESLLPIVEQTKGEITKVDPTQIHKNFSNILTTPIIATHVKATLTLHNLLKFRNEENLFFEGSRAVKDIGNANSDTLITFEYTVKPKNERKIQNQKQKELQKVPFQLAIEYQTLDGMKCIRVLTQQQIVTNKLQKAEENINMDVIADNARIKAAQQAQRGEYRGAQAKSLAWQSYMNQKSFQPQQQQIAQQYAICTSAMNNKLQTAQYEEQQQGFMFQDSEESSMNRKNTRKDNLTLELFQQQKANFQNPNEQKKEEKE